VRVDAHERRRVSEDEASDIAPDEHQSARWSEGDAQKRKKSARR
jgi:hypothetical protein